MSRTSKIKKYPLFCGRKGVICHNTLFYDLRSTRAVRPGLWKPTTNGKRNGMPVIPTLIRHAVNTTSTPSNRRSGIHDLSSIELKNPAVVQERTAQGLWI